MGDFAISEELKKAFESKNIKYYPIRTATAEEFYEAIGRAKETNDHGAFVTLDGTAGIAITKDNNIVSVFNGGQQKGVLKTLMPVAIENGGRKLDNYNSDKLSAMYELYGFNPVSMTEFNEKFAPHDWDYERDGTPDIVF